MSEWLNKQNKKHILLNGFEDFLNAQDNIVWFELALYQRVNLLNKKVSRISPRRHKKQKTKKVKKLNNENNLFDFNVDEILAAIDERS